MPRPRARAIGSSSSRSRWRSSSTSTGSASRKPRRRSPATSVSPRSRWAYVFSAFTLAYALFEIPTGWLGDRSAPAGCCCGSCSGGPSSRRRRAGPGIMLSMVVTRFLFGAGEAGCFPNLTKAFSAWLPTRDRTRAQALMWMGARWGGASAPLLVVAVMTFVSWRTAFLVFSLLGRGLGGDLLLVVPRQPARSPERQRRRTRAAQGERAERPRATATCPGGALATRPTMWLLGGAVLLPELRLVLLRDLAADVPEGRARHGDQVQRRS